MSQTAAYVRPANKHPICLRGTLGMTHGSDSSLFGGVMRPKVTFWRKSAKSSRRMYVKILVMTPYVSAFYHSQSGMMMSVRKSGTASRTSNWFPGHYVQHPVSMEASTWRTHFLIMSEPTMGLIKHGCKEHTDEERKACDHCRDSCYPPSAESVFSTGVC
jgi:hypothetical protein